MLRRRNRAFSVRWLAVLTAAMIVGAGVAVAGHLWQLTPAMARTAPPPAGDAVADRKIITINVTCYTEGVSRLCYAR